MQNRVDVITDGGKKAAEAVKNATDNKD